MNLEPEAEKLFRLYRLYIYIITAKAYDEATQPDSTTQERDSQDHARHTHTHSHERHRTTATHTHNTRSHALTHHQHVARERWASAERSPNGPPHP